MITQNENIIDRDDPILITGANGFVGSRVVDALLRHGYYNLRCFTRPSGRMTTLNQIIASYKNNGVKIIKGNLLSREDCQKAASEISVIYNLAAGMGKAFPAAFLNSVVATRNLLDVVSSSSYFKRFVNVSSFTVYSNYHLRSGVLLDETCEVDKRPELRGEAYCFGKVRQEQLIHEYHNQFALPFVIMRPGVVFGPGKSEITGRVGIGTFGIFLHLGGGNKIPFTYVDNCADAIALAGLKKDIDGEIFNIVDDHLPTSRNFLKSYKKEIGNFKSIYVPKLLSYFLCYLWEKYAQWSKGQLPNAFNRRRWSVDWKGNVYTNAKLKKCLGWQPRVPLDVAMAKYFEYIKKMESCND